MGETIVKEDILATTATPARIAEIIFQGFKMARYSHEALSPSLFFAPGEQKELNPRVYKISVMVEEVDYP